MDKVRALKAFLPIFLGVGTGFVGSRLLGGKTMMEILIVVTYALLLLVLWAVNYELLGGNNG